MPSPRVLCLLLVISAGKAQLQNKLQDQNIRVSTVHLPPLMVVRRHSDGVGYSGALFEQLDWLSRRLHFRYELNQEGNNRIGKLTNGSWDGLIGQLIRQETDLGLFPFTISHSRHQIMSFAAVFGGDTYVLLTKYPTEQKTIEAVFQPYSTQVWIGWIVSFVVVAISSVLFVFIRLKFANHRSRIRTMDDMLFYIIGTITAQGGYYRAGHRFLGILATSWCLAAFVFVNVYSTMLTSALATSYVSPEINSVQDLADSSTIKLVVIQGSTAEDYIKTSSSGSAKMVKEKLLHCSDCTTTFVEEIGRKVIKSNFVALQHSSSALGLIKSSFRTSKKCLLTKGYERFSWMHSFLAAPKSSQYIEEFNRESLWAHALGLPDKWGSFDPDDCPCLLKYNRRGSEVHSENRPLKWRQLYPAFCILFFGYVLAVAAFSYEKLTARRLKWRNG